MSKKSLMSFYICFFVFISTRTSLAEGANDVLSKILPRKEKSVAIKKNLAIVATEKKEKRSQKLAVDKELFRPILDVAIVDLKLDQVLPETDDYPIVEWFVTPPPACASCFK